MVVDKILFNTKVFSSFRKVGGKFIIYFRLISQLYFRAFLVLGMHLI